MVFLFILILGALLTYLLSSMFLLIVTTLILLPTSLILLLILLKLTSILVKFISKSKFGQVNGQIKDKNSSFTIGFFHPFCNSGGGGERVLWSAIKAIQDT